MLQNHLTVGTKVEVASLQASACQALGGHIQSLVDYILVVITNEVEITIIVPNQLIGLLLSTINVEITIIACAILQNHLAILIEVITILRYCGAVCKG